MKSQTMIQFLVLMSFRFMMEMTSGSTIQVACTSKYKPSQIPNDDHAGMSTRFYDEWFFSSTFAYQALRVNRDPEPDHLTVNGI